MRSYLADITSSKSRTARISFLSGMTILAMPIGSFMSRFVLEYGGHLAIWGTSLGCFTLSLLWIIFFVQDSRGKGSNLEIASGCERKKMEGNAAAVVLKNLLHCFAVTFKARPGNKRSCLTIILIMKFMSVFSEGVNIKNIFRNIFLKSMCGFRSLWCVLLVLEKEVRLGCS